HVEGDPAQCRHSRVGHAVDLVHVLQADQGLTDANVVGRDAHSTSPRRTDVTLLTSVARIASASETQAAATTATVNMPSANQSVTSTGAGNPRLMLGPSVGSISRSSHPANRNAPINEKATMAVCSPIMAASIVRCSVPRAR